MDKICCDLCGGTSNSMTRCGMNKWICDSCLEDEEVAKQAQIETANVLADLKKLQKISFKSDILKTFIAQLAVDYGAQRPKKRRMRSEDD